MVPDRILKMDRHELIQEIEDAMKYEQISKVLNDKKKNLENRISSAPFINKNRIINNYILTSDEYRSLQATYNKNTNEVSELENKLVSTSSEIKEDKSFFKILTSIFIPLYLLLVIPTIFISNKMRINSMSPDIEQVITKMEPYDKDKRLANFKSNNLNKLREIAERIDPKFRYTEPNYQDFVPEVDKLINKYNKMYIKDVPKILLGSLFIDALISFTYQKRYNDKQKNLRLMQASLKSQLETANNNALISGKNLNEYPEKAYAAGNYFDADPEYAQRYIDEAQKDYNIALNNYNNCKVVHNPLPTNITYDYALYALKQGKALNYQSLLDAYDEFSYRNSMLSNTSNAAKSAQLAADEALKQSQKLNNMNESLGDMNNNLGNMSQTQKDILDVQSRNNNHLDELVGYERDREQRRLEAEKKFNR